MSFKILLVIPLALSLAALEPGKAPEPSHHHHHHHGAPGHEGHDHSKSNDLIAFLEHHDEYSTLLGLLKQTGLDETVEGKGPFTLFAPTNDAFAKIPEATLDKLTRPDNQDALKALLLAHVVSGKLTTADLKPGTEVRTLGNTLLKVEKHDDHLTINGAHIEEADLDVENGVIHALDSVLLPRG